MTLSAVYIDPETNEPVYVFEESPSLNAPVAIAPGCFIADEDFQDFLDTLDSDAEALAAYFELVEKAGVPLTRANIDDTLWDYFAPVFDHINWNLKLAAGNPQALAVEAACEAFYEHRGYAATVKVSRTRRIQRSIKKFALEFGKH